MTELEIRTKIGTFLLALLTECKQEEMHQKKVEICERCKIGINEFDEYAMQERTVDVTTLCKLAKGLNISTDELLGIEIEKNAEQIIDCMLSRFMKCSIDENNDKNVIIEIKRDKKYTITKQELIKSYKEAKDYVENRIQPVEEKVFNFYLQEFIMSNAKPL